MSNETLNDTNILGFPPDVRSSYLLVGNPVLLSGLQFTKGG